MERLQTPLRRDWEPPLPWHIPELQAAGGEGWQWVLVSSFTQLCLIEDGNSFHPSCFPSCFRVSLAMSYQWLEAEQSWEPSTLPGTVGNLPISIFLSGRRYSHSYGWNRQTGRVDKGCLFIEQLLKKQKKKKEK